MALTADKTFYPTAKMAMDAPKEELAYVATLNVKENLIHYVLLM